MAHTLLTKVWSAMLAVLTVVALSGALLGGVGVEEAQASDYDDVWLSDGGDQPKILPCEKMETPPPGCLPGKELPDGGVKPLPDPEPLAPLPPYKNGGS